MQYVLRRPVGYGYALVCIVAGVCVLLVLLVPAALAGRYGLTVGIDEYEPGGPSSLSDCVNGANAIAQCLVADSSRWSAANITTLTDSAATRSAIRNHLSTLAAATSAGDLVLYYQCSHGGQYSGTDTYLCAYDVNYEDEQLATDLAAFHDGVTVIIALDTCHAAGMYDINSLDGPAPPNWDFARNVMRKYRERRINTGRLGGASIGWLTSCDFDEVSWSVNPFGVFTGYVLASLFFGDADGDGALTFSEIFDYAGSRTAFTAPGQNPQPLNTNLLAQTMAAAVCPSESSIQEAVDNASLPFTTVGHAGAGWYRQTAVSHNGADAARSGAIGTDRRTECVTSVNGPGRVSFWWKVSSEEDSGILWFAVDDMLRAELWGEIDWEERSFAVGPGRHLLRWYYEKNDESPGTEDCAWLDQVTWSPVGGTLSPSLGQALNNTLLPFRAGGDADWIVQSAVAHDGVSAAQSPVMTDSRNVWFLTSILGPGSLSFWWKVDSEEDCDHMRFYIDSREKQRISWETGWTQESFDIGAGWHVAGWQYAKDDADSEGQDRGWVDQVAWTGDCDTDGDGLPNQWEEGCGLDPASSNGLDGARGDRDQDGMDNRQEYVADTHPTNPASLLRLIDLSREPGGIRVEWKGGVLARQFLECQEQIDGTSGEWVAILTNEPPTSATTNILDGGVTNGTLFYRIKAER